MFYEMDKFKSNRNLLNILNELIFLPVVTFWPLISLERFIDIFVYACLCVCVFEFFFWTKG
jgi:hypothetical protein